jgi:hypothetical protein
MIIARTAGVTYSTKGSSIADLDGVPQPREQKDKQSRRTIIQANKRDRLLRQI